MPRVVAPHPGLVVTVGGAALAVATAGGLTACSAFLDDFVYDDAGLAAAADGATGGGGLDATMDAGAPGTDGAVASDGNGGDGDGDDVDGGRLAYRAAVLAAGPTAYWRFGEQGETTAYSVTGGGQYSALYINVGLGVPGAIDGDPDTAISFDGTMGVVRWNGSFPQIDQQYFSVEMWVRPTTAASSNLAFLVKYFDTTGISLDYAGAPGSGLHLAESNANGATNDDSTTDLLVGTWNYVVFQSNGEQLNLFLNMAMVGSSRALTPRDDAGDAGTAPVLNIGGDQNDYSTFTGDIDEVAVYSSPLTLVQMGLHYKLAGAHDGGS